MEKTKLLEKIEKAIELAGSLQNAWLEIPEHLKHPSDNIEHTRDIHNIQNRLMSIAYDNGISKNG